MDIAPEQIWYRKPEASMCLSNLVMIEQVNGDEIIFCERKRGEGKRGTSEFILSNYDYEKMFVPFTPLK